MHRVHVAREQLEEGAGRVRLDPRESRHLLQVLRASVGTAVVAFDGDGGEAPATVAAIERGRAVELDVGPATRSARPAARVTLGQVLPRGPRFELILQKATELGAYRIVPLVATRSVARPAPGAGAAKLEHWRQILIGAAKQSGNAFLPRLDPVRPLDEFLALAAGADLALMAAITPGARPLWALLGQGARRTPTGEVLLLIGPEGDFTPEETARARAAGFLPLSLGPRVLRSETAAICALALIGYELDRERPAGPAAEAP